MARQATTEKILFSTETQSVLASTVSNPGYYGAGFDNRGTCGYGVQGAPQYSDETNIYKMPFSTETISVLRIGVLLNGDAPGAPITHDKIYSAWYGGAYAAMIMFFDFSTEVQSFGQNNPLNVWRDNFGFSNSGSF